MCEELDQDVLERIDAHDPKTFPGGCYPTPTVDEPTEEEIAFWVLDSVTDATDGCEVEPDGVCPHGHPSWLIRLRLV